MFGGFDLNIHHSQGMQLPDNIQYDHPPTHVLVLMVLVLALCSKSALMSRIGACTNPGPQGSGVVVGTR